jgi:hypothetical protein
VVILPGQEAVTVHGGPHTFHAAFDEDWLADPARTG